MPGSSFACENNSAKHISKKEISSKSCSKDCCKKDSHSKNKEGCGGKCDQSKCGCASNCNLSISINVLNYNRSVFYLVSEKQVFYDYETNISSGFNSVWLIPKIG